MINIYAQSEKLIVILKKIAQAENFTCNFYVLKSGTKLITDAQNFIIIRKFPLIKLTDVNYILCTRTPNQLTQSQLQELFDVWPEPLTPALTAHFFRGLITKIKAANHSEASKYQKRLLEMAQQDYLTGLATRWYLHEYAESKRNEANLTCIYFDLDNFKNINDTYGHQEGDRALAATGEMMQREFPEGFCARMGGDEFMIVIPGENSAESVLERVNSFMKILLEYYSSVKTMKGLSVSAGISQKIDNEAKSIDQLIHESDIALYEAKNSGRACCKIYAPSMERKETINHYLVDYENVKNHGFKGIENIKGRNFVYIFYSKNAMGNFSLDFMKTLTEANAKFFFRKVEVGSKNALDFQLSSFLGEIIAENEGKSCNYFIISYDKGFNTLISFWAERNVKLEIIANFFGNPSINDLREKLSELLKADGEQTNGAAGDKRISVDVTDELISDVAEIIAVNKTKVDINNALNRKLKNAVKAGEIYRAIKPLISGRAGQP